MSPSRSLGLVLLASLVALAPAVVAYTEGGTFVVKAEGVTVVDDGAVICRGLGGNGVGGGCLPLPLPGTTREGGFVAVVDDAAGLDVAFQVCLDNNGDGVCGGPQPVDGRCRDQIFFSHAEGGRFFNALGPLPTTTLKDCPKAFQGYVVLLCQGVHDTAEAGPHQHDVTSGRIFATNSGSGFGDFCGGNGGGAAGPAGFVDAAAKAYRVV